MQNVMAPTLLKMNATETFILQSWKIFAANHHKTLPFYGRRWGRGGGGEGIQQQLKKPLLASVNLNQPDFELINKYPKLANQMRCNTWVRG